MPTYTYKCKRCGTIHEFKFHFNQQHDLSAKACSRCGVVGQFERVFTKIQIMYKAGGFYSTQGLDEQRKHNEYIVERK